MPSNRGMLHGYLAWTRSHVLSAVADLDDGELRAPRVPSGWSMAELVHHLAVDVERFWFLAVMAADPEAVGYFEEATASGWTIPAHLAPSGVLDLYRDECAKTDAYLANAAADSAPRWWPTGSDDELPADLAAVFVHALVVTRDPRRPPGHRPRARRRQAVPGLGPLAGRRAPINP